MTGPSAPALPPVCQRWRDGTHSWRHVSEGGFDRRAYDVSPIDEATARRFVLDHHYSGSYPSARLRYGLHRAGELVGVAVLSCPTSGPVLTNPFPDLTPYYESLELGRFVLLDEVPANSESWFLARAFKLAAGDGVAGVVSFSDPQPRGSTFPGHVGTIYQASNAVYAGRSTARRLTVLPDGTVLNDRARHKIVKGERGRAYVERSLVDLGARPLGSERPSVWLAEQLDRIGARKITHHGCHRYLFRLHRSVRVGMPTGGRYPKQPDPKPFEEATLWA